MCWVTKYSDKNNEADSSPFFSSKPKMYTRVHNVWSGSKCVVTFCFIKISIHPCYPRNFDWFSWECNLTNLLWIKFSELNALKRMRMPYQKLQKWQTKGNRSKLQKHTFSKVSKKGGRKLWQKVNQLADFWPMLDLTSSEGEALSGLPFFLYLFVW